MLVTHLDHSPARDRPLLYVFKDGWHTIDAPVLGQHPFLDGEHEVAPFALARAVPSELKERYPQLRFDWAGAGAGRRVVIRGSPGQLKEIRRDYEGIEYPVGPSGTFWMRQHVGLPFSVLDGDRVGGTLSLDDFCALPVRAFDSEFAGWEPYIQVDGLRAADDQIRGFMRHHGVCDAGSRENLQRRLEHFLTDNLATVMPEQPISLQLGELIGGKPLVHYFEHLAGVDGDATVAGIAVRNYRSSDAPSMLARSLDVMEREPFAVLVTQNGMSYDLLKLREYGKDASVPFELQGHSPRVRSASGFFRRVQLGPVLHFDFAPYAQNHLPFTIDNKFETLMSLILDRRIVKKQGYEDLTRLWVEMLLGREESSADLKEYGIDDVVFLLDAWQKAAPVAYHKSLAFGCGLEELCVTSTRTLALNRYKSSVIPSAGFFPWSRDEEQYGFSSFDASDAFSKHVSPPRIRMRPGIFSGAMYYLAPWLPVYGERLRSDPHMSALLDHALAQEDLWRVDILNSVQDGLLLPVLFEHERRSRFSRSEAEIRRLSSVVDRYQRLVQFFPPRNADGFFHVWDEHQVADPLFAELSYGLAWPLSSGRVLNVRRGAFALHDGITRFVRGFDSKMSRGFSSVFEQELGARIVDEALLSSPKDALRVLHDGVARVRSGDVPLEELLYVRRSVARDFMEYSAPAQRQMRVRAYMQSRVEAGEPFARAPVGGKWLDLVELEQVDDVFSDGNIRYWVDHLLGPERVSGRDFRRGSVGRFAPALLASTRSPGSVLMDGLRQYHLAL